MNIWHILLTLLMLSVLILLHELGHYTAARIFSVPINEFALGMGPKIFSRRSKKTGTIYSLKLLPIGGYVSMVGEDESTFGEDGFSNKPVWQRMIITAAGAFMNFVAGFVLMAVVVMMSSSLGSTTVHSFADGALTEETGLRVGDKIIAVGGERVFVAGDLSYVIMHDATEPVDLTVIRNGEKLRLHDVVFPTDISEGIEFGRADFSTEREAKNFINVVKHTFFRSLSAVKMVWESIIDLVSGKYGVEHISGPVGVTTAVSDAAKNGVGSFLFLTVAITMNLGVFNILPLPALDGGRLAFQLVELLRGKPLKPEIEGYIHFAGIVILMGLMVVITFKDVIGLFS